MNSEINNRAMEAGDLEQVLRIERAAYPEPWSQGVFADCLRAGYQCELYLRKGHLVGYSVVSVGAGEAHLLNLCLHPDHQGRGWGREVLRQILNRLCLERIETVFLEVRVSNQAARHLYLSEGFNEIGQRFNYYPNGEGREDALVFAKSLL